MTTRRLAAILAADVVGFSSLMGKDEEGTLERIKSLRREVIEPKVKEHHGRVFKTTGDGFLIEFASPVEAVRCAVAVQEVLASQALQLRVGINLGDIIIEDDGDVYGDGVNVAARLEQLARPGGISISGKVYEEVRDKLPYAFDDQGDQSVKNIARPVRVYQLSSGDAERPRIASAERVLRPPDRPSIAVLPFTNMSGNPEHEFFADGMTEDIITGLSRLRWLFVIARNTTFVYKGQSVDVRQVGRDLGVRYVLEGSVRTAGNRIRVTGQLVEAGKGGHIWAEKYDREVKDIFDLQDEITQKVVAAIQPHLYAAEGVRATSQPPENLSSWGLVVRALGLINKVGRKENHEARALLTQAIELEPTYAKAHAVLSWAAWWLSWNYWVEDEEQERKRAQKHAEDASALDPSEPWARMVLGLCLSSDGFHDRALRELEAALEVNPSFALAHTIYGWALARSGRFEDAVDQTRMALRLSPSDSYLSLYEFIHGFTLFAARRFGDALPYLRKAVAAFPEFPTQYVVLMSCCGHLGLVEEAIQLLARRNALGPPVTVSLIRRNTQHYATCDVMTEGLVKAGIPES